MDDMHYAPAFISILWYMQQTQCLSGKAWLTKRVSYIAQLVDGGEIHNISALCSVVLAHELFKVDQMCCGPRIIAHLQEINHHMVV